MVFKRRKKQGSLTRFREFLYPRKGFWRGFGYIGQRMRRLPDTPHRIALGFAAGAFASFTPLFTLHFFVAAFISWLIRGNILAALFGTIVGNPITFPVIATTAMWLGDLILGREGGTRDFKAVMLAFGDSFTALWHLVRSLFGAGTADLEFLTVFFDGIFLPYMVGGVVMGIPAALISYALVGPVVATYQTRRQRRFDQRIADRAARQRAEQEAYASHDSEGDNA